MRTVLFLHAMKKRRKAAEDAPLTPKTCSSRQVEVLTTDAGFWCQLGHPLRPSCSSLWHMHPLFEPAVSRTCSSACCAAKGMADKKAYGHRAAASNLLKSNKMNSYFDYASRQAVAKLSHVTLRWLGFSITFVTSSATFLQELVNLHCTLRPDSFCSEKQANACWNDTTTADEQHAGYA